MTTVITRNKSMPEIDPQNDTYDYYSRTITLPNGLIVTREDTPSVGADGTLQLALDAIRIQKQFPADK